MAQNTPTTAEEQALIGKLLTHNPKPRMGFMMWWHSLDVELHARGCQSDSVWSEAHPLYHECRTMTPAEAAERVLRDRAAVGNG